LDPSKDLAAYGFGSVTWKERMESWKTRQEKLQVMRADERQALSGGKGGDDDYDDADLPVYVIFCRKNALEPSHSFIMLCFMRVLWRSPCLVYYTILLSLSFVLLE
jgi:hypothetical protein